MAKKAGAAQLQVDVTTDEELDRFLDNPGLCLLDVYSDWCGPCLAMVTTLRKAKMEGGGEFLFLATCKADNIQALARFRNKSEPTWLFVAKNKSINITYGCDIPKLLKMIQIELQRVMSGKPITDAVLLHELLPIEKERVAKIAAQAEKERLAKEREIKKKRLDYLNYCTGEVLSYLPGFGVTLFGPQVQREHLKKVLEIAETENLACKDKKAHTLKREDIEVLHYACNNPINEDVLEQMYGKDLLVCYWKMADTDTRSTEEVLNILVAKLIKSQIGDDGEEKPPILTPLEIKVKPEKKESIITAEIKLDFMLPTDDQGEEEEEEGVEEDDMGEEVESLESIAVRKSSSYLFMVTLPAMWTPGNKKTTGAAIYVFFRNQTTGFLPPDPVPEPPHLIVVFDAWKRKDVTDVMNKYSDEILSYGYFTSEEPEKAELIANSNSAYSKQKFNRFDKLVVKVAKVTSHAVLALASHSPVYVSPNTEIGKIEALKFFPEDYNNEDEPEPEPPKPTEKKKAEAAPPPEAPAEAENVPTEDVPPPEAAPAE